MAVHAELSPSEAADRLAIRELFDAYAHCADRRDAEGQKALFTVDTRFVVYLDGHGGTRDPDRGKRAADALNARFVQFDVTDDASVEATARTLENSTIAERILERASNSSQGCDDCGHGCACRPVTSTTSMLAGVLL
jgi:SnoaL-like protein